MEWVQRFFFRLKLGNGLANIVSQLTGADWGPRGPGC